MNVCVSFFLGMFAGPSVSVNILYLEFHICMYA